MCTFNPTVQNFTQTSNEEASNWCPPSSMSEKQSLHEEEIQDTEYERVSCEMVCPEFDETKTHSVNETDNEIPTGILCN